MNEVASPLTQWAVRRSISGALSSRRRLKGGSSEQVERSVERADKLLSVDSMEKIEEASQVKFSIIQLGHLFVDFKSLGN